MLLYLSIFVHYREALPSVGDSAAHTDWRRGGDPVPCVLLQNAPETRTLLQPRGRITHTHTRTHTRGRHIPRPVGMEQQSAKYPTTIHTVLMDMVRDMQLEGDWRSTDRDVDLCDLDLCESAHSVCGGCSCCSRILVQVETKWAKEGRPWIGSRVKGCGKVFHSDGGQFVSVCSPSPRGAEHSCRSEHCTSRQRVAMETNLKGTTRGHQPRSNKTQKLYILSSTSIIAITTTDVTS